MVALSQPVTILSRPTNSPLKPLKTPPSICSLNLKFHNRRKHVPTLKFPLTSCCISSPTRASEASTILNPSSSSYTNVGNRHWMVLMDKPPHGLNSKAEIVDYFVNTLATVLRNEKEAQMSLYDASWHNHFGFCCDVDEDVSRELARVPGVLSVRPDLDFNSENKDYSSLNVQPSVLDSSNGGIIPLFQSRNTKHWIVRMDKPGVGVVTKAQMVDYYVHILTKVLGNEKDAQMCIYHVSWQSNFGFCCELDDICAKELAGVPGVLAVNPDMYFESENKDYGGGFLSGSTGPPDAPEASQETPVTTKKLFVTGLSFYTSEKTLRAAFEGFGELVAVKIIMDKISKRSKGFAFIEYTTVEAASAALKEMNGKIINGWMIVVDVAKTKPPPKYSRGQETER